MCILPGADSLLRVLHELREKLIFKLSLAVDEPPYHNNKHRYRRQQQNAMHSAVSSAAISSAYLAAFSQYGYITPLFCIDL